MEEFDCEERCPRKNVFESMDEKPTAREFHRANVFFESGNCALLPTHGAPLPQQRPTANNLRAHWQQQVQTILNGHLRRK